MSDDLNQARIAEIYEKAARKYFLSIPLEDTIDPTCQAHNRMNTVSSFSLISLARPDIHCFNELLITYPRSSGESGRVVPNNFVVVHPEPIRVHDCYEIPLLPSPLLAIDYINDYRNPKCYENNFERYGHELTIPYYLRVHSEEKEFFLHRLSEGNYAPVQAIDSGRFPIPELELEVGLYDGWLRYWFRGEMVLLPAELQREIMRLDEALVKTNEQRRLLKTT